MADVVQTDLVEFDVIDYDSYEDGGSSKSYAPPPEGRYTGRAPIFKDDGTDVISETNSFGRTKEGRLKVSLDPVEIVGDPTHSGYKVRFTEASSKKYANRNGSQAIDFLRACGIDARPQSEKELRAAILTASGRTFQFGLVWEAYNKDTRERTQGQDNFPPNPQNPSERLPYITDEFDSSKKWYANGRVKYFISAVQK